MSAGLPELGARLAESRARAAARAGDLDRAASLLDDLGDSDVVAVLDVRARVHAQRGEFAEADACWARVQATVPDHRGARRGRDAAAKILAGRHRPRPLIPASWAAVVAVVLIGAAGTGGAIWLSADRSTSVTAVDAASGQRAEAAARRDRQLAAIAGRLAVPGVSLDRRAEDIRVVFQAGLFTSGTRLGPGGGALLAEIGQRLEGLGVTTTVVGHAVVVPGGPTGGGSPVALARAQTAAERLAAASGLPLTAFTLVSADQADGPFGEAPRNRTVTLIIRPNGQP